MVTVGESRPTDGFFQPTSSQPSVTSKSSHGGREYTTIAQKLDALGQGTMVNVGGKINANELRGLIREYVANNSDSKTTLTSREFALLQSDTKGKMARLKEGLQRDDKYQIDLNATADAAYQAGPKSAAAKANTLYHDILDKLIEAQIQNAPVK